MRQAIVVCLGLLLASTGCVIESDHRYADHTYVPAGPTAQYIDSDLGVDATPGNGVAVLVEYARGGSWHVRTFCDTLVSGQPCTFQVYGQSFGGPVFGLLPSDSFGADDDLGTYGTDEVSLRTTTTTEVDGAWFDTNAGDSVTFTTLLDGVEDSLLSWRSGGAVIANAASPVTLTPSAP